MRDMLTARDIEEMLQVDRSTVYRMAEQDRLPALKVGRQWRFPAQAIEEWLANRGLDTRQNNGAAQKSLAETLPLDCVQLMQDTYADALGIMLVVTDMKGKPVTEVSNPCGFFELLQDSPQLWEQCYVHWQALAATPDMMPRFSRSPLGLLCARGLIRHGAELKGMLFAGGVAPAQWPPADEELDALAQRFGVPQAKIRARRDEVFHLERPQQAHVLSLVQRIADVVAHIVDERSKLLDAA